MTLKAVELQAGDKVAAQGDDPAYEVLSINAQQGRVQIADTGGEVHTYHRDDMVEVSGSPKG
jgi:hypothetical protein